MEIIECCNARTLNNRFRKVKISIEGKRIFFSTILSWRVFNEKCEIYLFQMLGKICLTLNIYELCNVEGYCQSGVEVVTESRFQNLRNLGLKFGIFD